MIDRNFINKMHEFLDKIEASEGPAIVVTIGSGPKVFCSGFNLFELTRLKHNRVLLPMDMLDVYVRFLTLNVPCLCAVNGHCVAGGLFLALCHDKTICVDKPSIKI